MDQETRQWLHSEIISAVDRRVTIRASAPKVADPETFDGSADSYIAWKHLLQVYVAGLGKDDAIRVILSYIKSNRLLTWKKNLTHVHYKANDGAWDFTSLAAFWKVLDDRMGCCGFDLCELYHRVGGGGDEDA